MRTIGVGILAALLTAAPLKAQQQPLPQWAAGGQELPPQPPRHDLVETNRLCENMGGAWTMTNPSPGRFFCALRFDSVIVTVVALTDGTMVYTAAGGVEEDRIRAVWLILDSMNARMLGPAARNVTLMLDTNINAYVSMTVEDRQTIINVVPPGSGPYRQLRELATTLGSTPPPAPI